MRVFDHSFSLGDGCGLWSKEGRLFVNGNYSKGCEFRTDCIRAWFDLYYSCVGCKFGLDSLLN